MDERNCCLNAYLWLLTKILYLKVYYDLWATFHQFIDLTSNCNYVKSRNPYSMVSFRNSSGSNLELISRTDPNKIWHFCVLFIGSAGFELKWQKTWSDICILVTGTRTKAELLKLNRTQFSSLGIFDSKKVWNLKNEDHFYYIGFKSCILGGLIFFEIQHFY